MSISMMNPYKQTKEWFRCEACKEHYYTMDSLKTHQKKQHGSKKTDDNQDNYTPPRKRDLTRTNIKF